MVISNFSVVLVFMSVFCADSGPARGVGRAGTRKILHDATRQLEAVQVRRGPHLEVVDSAPHGYARIAPRAKLASWRDVPCRRKARVLRMPRRCE
jgi:hypothetical protein